MENNKICTLIICPLIASIVRGGDLKTEEKQPQQQNQQQKRYQFKTHMLWYQLKLMVSLCIPPTYPIYKYNNNLQK